MNWILTPEIFLTEEEVQNLRKSCKDATDLANSKGQFNAIRTWMILDLGLQAGLRVGEISNLEIKDLFIEKSVQRQLKLFSTTIIIPVFL